MSKKISVSKRSVVFSKTGGVCAYCEIDLDPEMFAIDHVHPRFHGGTNDIQNLLPCCHSCNSSKGTKGLEEFRIFVAARSVAGPLFGLAQINYLRAAGTFPLLGFNENHTFPFERQCAAVS